MFYIKKLLQLVVFTWVSIANASSYDAFFQAIQVDDDASVIALFARGFDPNTPSPKGEYPLILSLQTGSLKVSQVLLNQRGIQVEVRTANDESPLMLAALKGYVDICTKLMDRDADVNKPGWTPLHYAATGGHQSVVQLLLAKHAYIDAASPNGSTPLMMAAKYGNATVVKQLLEAGADPLIKNDLGLSAIDFAISNQRTDSVNAIAAAIRAQRPKGAW